MQTRSRKLSQTIVAEDDGKTKSNKKSRKSTGKQDTDAIVASILSSINEENSSKTESSSTSENNTENKTNVTQKRGTKVVRGMPKSGRPWKEVKQKFSNIKKSLYRRSFEKKQLLREELKHIKELSKSIKEDKRLENVAKKERRDENAQRRLENERKSEVVQVIKNPAKLKRMKKKALRKIEKRDLTAANGPKVLK